MDTSGKKNGGPAFPQPIAVDPIDRAVFYTELPGLSIRDWFASQALIGVMSVRETSNVDLLARTAYQLADAMLAERAKQ